MPAWKLCLGLSLLILPTATRATPPAGKVDYNFHVRPILSDRCFLCHGPDEKTRKAKLRLDTRDGAVSSGAVVPGKPDDSPLVERITATDRTRMPPKKANLSLSPDEVETLRRWIAEGAEYKPHWAFLPLPDAVPLPSVSDRTWPAGGLDHFVLSRLDREGLMPSPAASKEDWIRRVTFDLTGLPPTPDEVDAFLKDESPKAFEAVADRLLKSPRYGERMAMDWLDVARYADSFGYQADGDMHVWPWRDWVIGAFNENLPYDQFLTWQLAGDRLPNPTREQRLATAFNRLHRMTNEGGSIPEEWRNESVSDRVHTFGTAFLALTLECCRCHDHKYDPLPTKDYYALGAFFNSLDEWGTYDNSAFRPTPTLALPTPEQEKALAEHDAKVTALEAKVREAESAREDAFRQWLARTDLKPDLPGLVGHYPPDGPRAGNKLENKADAKHPGSTSAANTFVPGKIGQALRFTGDDPATFAGVLGNVECDQPFTAAFWLQVPRVPKWAIVFHRQSGTDTGFHGTELSFDDGRLMLALVRFWPGNTAAVRTRSPLPAGAWVHVAATSDGSGRAAGLSLFLDGKPADTEVVRDRLTKDLQPGIGHGAGQTGLTFGERFRSVGLDDGKLDEVHLFDRPLTPVEVAHLHDGKSLTEALARKDAEVVRPYFFATTDPETAKLRTELKQARRQRFAAQTGVNEILAMEDMPEPRRAFVLARGEYDAPKDRPVGRGTPSSLPPFPADAPRDRLGLARWLTQPNHPLTARVAAKRFWQQFFGRGLVATTDNFGLQGALPTHPELLDWLARDFVASGWDVKGLCKKIVLSATYRQRSAATAQLRERDPENLLLARAPARRLSAEMPRDAALFAGGLLVEKVGGPPVKPYQPAGLWRGRNAFLPDYVPDKGDGLYRRSFYTFWRRTSPPPNMLAFDAPSREVCVVRRQTTNTPLQSLVLLNDPQFVEAARGLGERLLRHDGPLPEKLRFAFRLAASRNPTERELAVLQELYQQQREEFRGQPEAAKKYLGTGSRPIPKGLDPGELATAAATASAVLNLDATLMTR